MSHPFNEARALITPTISGCLQSDASYSRRYYWSLSSRMMRCNIFILSRSSSVASVTEFVS